MVANVTASVSNLNQKKVITGDKLMSFAFKFEGLHLMIIDACNIIRRVRTSCMSSGN